MNCPAMTIAVDMGHNARKQTKNEQADLSVKACFLVTLVMLYIVMHVELFLHANIIYYLTRVRLAF